MRTASPWYFGLVRPSPACYRGIRSDRLQLPVFTRWQANQEATTRRVTMLPAVSGAQFPEHGAKAADGLQRVPARGLLSEVCPGEGSDSRPRSLQNTLHPLCDGIGGVSPHRAHGREL